MKTSVIRLIFAVFILGIIAVSCAHLQKKPKYDTKHNIVIGEERILIPGTEISNEDYQAMNTILTKYDKALYKVERYENAKLQKTRGKLSAIVTEKEFTSEMAENIKKPGFTQAAVQVGGFGTHVSVSHSPSPRGVPAHPMVSQRKLVAELTPILEKYRRK